jgi:hypothetical protein
MSDAAVCYRGDMATQSDVRRLATALPGVTPSATGFAFSVDRKGKAKGFAWVWQERVIPKQPRVPNPDVLAVRVADQTEKASLLAADDDKFFTEPHYNGFPAVLVRLSAVTVAELQLLLAEAWRCLAPKELVAAYDAPDEPDRAPAIAVARDPRDRSSAARAAKRAAKPAAKRAAASKPTSSPAATRAAKLPRSGR